MRRRHGSPAHHLAALGSSMLGLLLASVVSPYLDTYTVLPSLAAVLISAWFGGMWPGLLATVTSVVGINLVLIEPVYSLGVPMPSDVIRLSFFVVVSLATSYASQSLRRTAEALRESQLRMRLFVDSVRDHAIFFLDAEGRVSQWTNGARRVLGHAADEIVGRPFADLVPPGGAEDGTAEEQLRIAAGTGAYAGEGHHVRAGGQRFWAQVSLTALYREGELIGFATVVRDMAEHRRAELALRDANEEIAATTYAIAHDLRSPLRAIDAYSYMLLLESGDRLDDEARGNLDRIRGSAQRLGGLIDALLALARVGRGSLTVATVDLGALARAALEEERAVAPQRRVELRLGGRLDATGDPRLLGVVVQNLIGNAFKFTAARAEAVIEVGSAAAAGGRVYYVRDNGIGFESSHAAKLFRPFHRLHAEDEFPGIGIGLATVRRIVERHGGRAWAEGHAGEGASIYFQIPNRPPRTTSRIDT